MSIESADDWKGLRRAGRIAHLTLEALEAHVRPGVSTAEFTVVRGLTGHGVGRSIHEEPSVPNHYDPSVPNHYDPSVPNHYDPWQRDVLTDGLVLTIEPIISAGSDRIREDPDGWTMRTADGSLSAHHEHTLVITRDRPTLLTAG